VTKSQSWDRQLFILLQRSLLKNLANIAGIAGQGAFAAIPSSLDE
jgi:hypothetical protein